MLLAFVAVLLCVFVPPAGAQDKPTVESFSPQGFVKQVRQVAVRFSESMRPLGDLRGRDPFRIECTAPGQGRWVDDRSWAYDFNADLTAGQRCIFTLLPSLRTLSGRSPSGPMQFRFWTGGPAVTREIPYEGSTIAEDQVFVLGVDAVPTDESVLASAHFAVDGILEPIGVSLVKGQRAEELKKAAGWYDSGPAVLLEARRPFPSDKVVRLIWGKGVQDAQGAATDADQTLTFKTRPAFTALLTCQRADAQSGCIPFLPIRVDFTAPVRWEAVRKAVLREPGGRTWSPAEPPRPGGFQGGESETDPGGARWVSGLVFNGPFPAETSLKAELPADVADDAGRALTNASKFPLEFQTGEYPPLAKFPARFGILELNASPVLPVTLRNVEPAVRARLLQVGGPVVKGVLDSLSARFVRAKPDPREIMERLRAVFNAKRETPVLTEGAAIAVPKPHGAKAFEVVGIPLRKPGLYIVELESFKLGEALLGRKAPLYVPTAALVTNLSVHLKWGRDASLVWVTSLDRALPVRGAEVTLVDATGKTLWTGRTGPDGTARPIIPAEDKLPMGPGWRLMAMAQLGDDYSFVFDSWSQGIETWRFQVPYAYGARSTDLRRTVLDRALVRAGETVHMKHFLRRETMDGFSLPPRDQWPDKLTIEHLGSQQRWELPVSWSPDGTAVTDWTVPKEAHLGAYEVVLPNKDNTWDWFTPDETAAAFRVEEFRVPILKGEVQPPASPLIAVSSIPVHIDVRYISGGGASKLPVVLRSQAQPKEALTFEGFDGFTFAGQAMAGGEPGERVEPAPALRTQDLQLDGTGGGAARLEGDPGAKTPEDLLVELEYRDPSGETQTIGTRLALWPSAVLVGLKTDSWAFSAKELKFKAAVVDLQGKPVAGAPVEVKLHERRYRSFRKRLVGGFYAYESSQRLVDHGLICQGVTNARGILDCDATSPVSGNVILEASAADSLGRPAATHMDVWVAGKEDWWFDVSDSDRMDVLPQKSSYEPGQTALFQVRMPFRQATALVTVEREGVIDSYVRHLSGKKPVVSIPIKPNYAPNVFVSVLAVRGRVGTPQPTALVDLARPAYRMGIAQIRVGWKSHELRVSVSPEHPVYKIRQTASADIAATLPDGSPAPAGSEAAVAVVDEALLELMPNDTWNLLDAMMSPRGLAVRTATAQMQVVGKRHFGLKALPQGGGGGRQATRTLFDTLLYWNPRVPLDARGHARVRFPLNDSISGFRIAAVVSSGVARFGTGEGRFRTTQDLSVLSGLAPLVREGDRFDALFTVRDATQRPMDVTVAATVSASGAAMPALDGKSVHLGAGESTELSWPIRVPAGVSSLSFDVAASERGGERDAVRVTQRVAPAVPVQVLQATLAEVEGVLKLPVAKPDDAVSGRGGVRVSFSPSLAGSVQGLIDYMSGYPYGCLEQRVSKAVALQDEKAWKATMDALPSYLDGEGLAKYFPDMPQGSEALTAYLVSIADEAGWEIPAASKDRMAKGLQAFIEGRIQRGSSLATNDLAYRKLAAAEALSRLGPLAPSLLQSIPAQPQLWPTSAVLDWRAIHQRMSGPDAAAQVAEADRILRARLNLQGTIMGFSTEKTDSLWWLMVSGDVNAVRLILTVLNDPAWKPDLPRLLRGALSRQERGHWDLTLANAWGRLALDKFAKTFEAGPVAGTTTASLGTATAAVAWKEQPSGGSLDLAWPDKSGELDVRHEGSGKPWATVQSRAAIPLLKPLSSGYKIERTLSAIIQKTPGRWSRGDIVRVTLKVSAQADMSWVVVDDPVPGGATILGSGLGRDSRLATQGEKSCGCVWPAYQERSFEAFRSYYDYVPKGDFSLQYTLRLNNAGDFNLPPTRVEAMYSPEMFGEIPNEPLSVGP